LLIALEELLPTGLPDPMAKRCPLAPLRADISFLPVRRMYAIRGLESQARDRHPRREAWITGRSAKVAALGGGLGLIATLTGP
jgi:hypothetical protein